MFQSSSSRNRQASRSLRKSGRRNKKSICSGEVLRIVGGVCGVLGLAAFGLLHEIVGNKSASSLAISSSASSLLVHPKNAAMSKDDIVPALPIFAPIPNAQQYIDDTLQHGRPSMRGIVAILQNFLTDFHKENVRLSQHAQGAREVIQTYFDLSVKHLRPLDAAYRDVPIFPIREDESIFLSLAAFREHLLADTLEFAFAKAQHPEKLFVGVVVQNCFGTVSEDGRTIDPTGKPCFTGAQVVGKDKNGHDTTKVSEAPPDANGIADFCAKPDFQKYCSNGQLRVLYVHETESVGPAVARYHASKLWGGETYFMQCDSHLMFADEWDRKYREEIQAARSFPKAILSSYPPGFQGVNAASAVKETTGTRLCYCETRLDDPNPIIRINSGRGYRGNETRPTQIPFIAAGFFLARAEFLVDVPFDPYMPWLFMGEEIALSMRAWTHGWDIYAPRKNLIAHQYRPGRMGLPKFWGTVNRLYRHAGIGNNGIQKHVIKRTKHMVGYPDSTLEVILAAGNEVVLTDIEHYSIGTTRTWDEYMDFAYMHVDQEHDAIDCRPNQWCNRGLKE